MKILLTRRAVSNLDAIVQYIADKWGKSASATFLEKVDSFFNVLEKYPGIGQIEKDDIRGFQISAQTRVLYRIKSDSIIILSFFDVRQHPGRKY
jgi:plasmid stabilization system protein ParE